jgi:hypothetical protein
MLKRLMGKVLRFVVVRPASKKSIDAIITDLEQNGQALSQKMHAAPDTPKNRNQIAHIVGIERWGLNRMHTVFGEPMGEQEHDPYRPNDGLTTDQMADAFDETRAETLALARKAKEAGKLEAAAPHNDMGDISLKAWLFYLDSHADREAGRIRT